MQSTEGHTVRVTKQTDCLVACWLIDMNSNGDHHLPYKSKHRLHPRFQTSFHAMCRCFLRKVYRGVGVSASATCLDGGIPFGERKKLATGLEVGSEIEGFIPSDRPMGSRTTPGCPGHDECGMEAARRLVPVSTVPTNREFTTNGERTRARFRRYVNWRVLRGTGRSGQRRVKRGQQADYLMLHCWCGSSNKYILQYILV